MKHYTVTVHFAHQLYFVFTDISEENVTMFKHWAKGWEGTVLEFVWKNEHYFLNRDFFCVIDIVEEK